MKKTTIIAVLALLVLGLFAIARPASATQVAPIFYEGNPTCIDIGFDFGFKDDDWDQKSFPYSNSVDLTGDSVHDLFWSSDDGKVLDWSSTFGIDAVIMKSQGANVYFYDPEAFGDTGLISPETKDISHVEFCYDYELDVSKDANTSFTRTYEWDITKSVDPAEWWMFAGGSGTSGYTVSVDKTGYTDSDWAVAGTITIENNTPFDAIITGVSDVVSPNIAASVDCGVFFPYTLPDGDTLTCSYSIPLPDGSDRTNTATVATSKTEANPVGGGEAEAAVTFGDPTTEINAEINVTDDYGTDTDNSDDKYWGPFGGSTDIYYGRTFECSSDPADYTNGYYMYEVNNVAAIDETGQEDDAWVTVHCYAPVVSKDAHTSFTRTWAWTIDKSADQTELTLSLGQQFLVNYSVMVDATYTDSDWAVAGTITVQNPNPEAAMTVSLADVVSPGIVATLDCGGSLTVPAGGSAICDYSADLPDASQRLNTATATLNSIDFTGAADVIFGDPAEEVDECIDVSDDLYGFLGTVCANGAPRTFPYSMTVGPYGACGMYEFTNTASFATTDTGTEGSDSWTVYVNVPCAGGCTLTQGYWKTHSSRGPAPYDDTWDAKGGGDADFFGTAYSYYEILWMPPKGGNAYLILAHQYIAAELNVLNGADMPSEVLDAWNQAGDLLVKYEKSMKIPKRSADRALAIELYELLDDYNNGLIGPGHCSE